MTPEERQRQMDFLLEQQARHDHEIAQIRRVDELEDSRDNGGRPTH